MKLTTGQKQAAGGGVIAIVLGLFGGWLYFNRKLNVISTATGCGKIRALYMWIWKDPILDPSGKVRWVAGFNSSNCQAFIQVPKGFYRIAIVDNLNNIYYCQDMTINQNTAFTVDISKSSGSGKVGDGVGILPVPIPRCR